jgi:hypothetical protein
MTAQLRLYFVSHTNILREMANYNSGEGNWYPGVLDNQNFTVDPGSSLSAAIPPLHVTFASSGRIRYAIWDGYAWILQ